MKASIVEVARLAGVSTSTVSRVYSRPDKVSAKTRDKVLAAAESLNFYISRSATVLKSGQSMRIALLVGSRKIDWFTARIIEGLNTVFRDARYDLVIFPIVDPEERKEFFTHLPLRGNVDAVIVSSFDIRTEEVERLHSAHVPILGINISSLDGFTASVSISNKEGTQLAVNHLVQLGHTHIGYIYQAFAEELHFSSADRIHHFEQACHERDITYDITRIQELSEASEVVCSRVLSSSDDTTAFFFHQDSLAVPTIVKLKESGIRIPEDVSIIGFDNSTFSGEVGLTTIKQKPLHIAMSVAQKALTLIGGDYSAATHDIAPVRLTVRHSTGKVREP